MPRLPALSALAVALLLAACQSLPPPLAFERAEHPQVHRLLMMPLGLPDHAQVTIMNPIGAGFGVVGNLIESKRTANANEEMAIVLSQAHYDFGSALDKGVALAMRKAGFVITRAAGARPPKERGRFLSHYTASMPVDGFLDVYVRYVGFQAVQSSVDYRPRVEIVARLVRAKDNQVLFQNRVVYGLASLEDEEAVLVRADDSVSFYDRPALQANPALTARALQRAVDAISWELALQFM